MFHNNTKEPESCTYTVMKNSEIYLNLPMSCHLICRLCQIITLQLVCNPALTLIQPIKIIDTSKITSVHAGVFRGGCQLVGFILNLLLVNQEKQTFTWLRSFCFFFTLFQKWRVPKLEQSFPSWMLPDCACLMTLQIFLLWLLRFVKQKKSDHKC